MPRVTSQRTSERKFFRPSHLADSPKIDLARLQEDNLNAVEYRACLTHWTTITSGYPKMRGSVSAAWCREFISRLSNRRGEFCDIVEAGMGKVAEDRQIHDDFRGKAGGDPIFYLNLNGVAPVQVLYVLGDVQARVEEIKRVARLTRELESETTQAIARLRKTLGRYDRIFSAAVNVGPSLSALENEYLRFAAAIAHASG
jgi:hypothetical protein